MGETMGFPRLIAASAFVGVGVWPLFHQADPMVSGPPVVSFVSIAMVILVGGWKGFTVVYHA